MDRTEQRFRCSYLPMHSLTPWSLKPHHFFFSLVLQAPTDTSRRRSSPLSLTSQVLRETAGPDEEKMSWYHNKLYQTPSSATSSSIANRQTPKQVYSHPTSTRRSSLVDDRLLTRQLYQSPAEALHAINQRRKSRELLRPLSTEEYLLSIGETRIRSFCYSIEDVSLVN